MSTTTPRIKVCVFCGASGGKNDAHLRAARQLAALFHKHNIQLIYGGGTNGVMGELAKTLVSLSGPDSVHGIIPRALLRYERKNQEDEQELDAEVLINKAQYGRTTVVESMHERKQLFATEVKAGAKGSGFVAMSGGYGTLEELLEVTTWNQLNIHGLPVVVYNINGLYDGLFATINTAVEEGFITEPNQSIMQEAKTADDVVNRLFEYELSSGRLGHLDWDEGKS